MPGEDPLAYVQSTVMYRYSTCTCTLISRLYTVYVQSLQYEYCAVRVQYTCTCSIRTVPRTGTRIATRVGYTGIGDTGINGCTVRVRYSYSK